MWATAVVAAGSAIGGALIGGYVSYRGNLRLSNAQRRVRAAVRRKAKVYVPLKLELHQLQSSLDQDQHLRWGIDLGEGPARRPKGTPVFELWRGLVADGRASFATSDEVQKRLKALAQTVEEFRCVRSGAGKVFQAIGQPLYAEATGNDKRLTGFDSYSLADAVRNPETPWKDWRFPDTPGFPDFRVRFNGTSEVQESRAAVIAADRVLRTKLAEAVKALDEGITRISRREEKESPKD